MEGRTVDGWKGTDALARPWVTPPRIEMGKEEEAV